LAFGAIGTRHRSARRLSIPVAALPAFPADHSPSKSILVLPRCFPQLQRLESDHEKMRDL
jgi:hypothetical protein